MSFEIQLMIDEMKELLLFCNSYCDVHLTLWAVHGHRKWHSLRSFRLRLVSLLDFNNDEELRGHAADIIAVC